MTLREAGIKRFCLRRLEPVMHLTGTSKEKKSEKELTEHHESLWELLTHIVWNTKHWLKSDAILNFPTHTHWTKTRVFILSARPCT